MGRERSPLGPFSEVKWEMHPSFLTRGSQGALRALPPPAFTFFLVCSGTLERLIGLEVRG